MIKKIKTDTHDRSVLRTDSDKPNEHTFPATIVYCMHAHDKKNIDGGGEQNEATAVQTCEHTHPVSQYWARRSLIHAVKPFSDVASGMRNDH